MLAKIKTVEATMVTAENRTVIYGTNSMLNELADAIDRGDIAIMVDPIVNNWTRTFGGDFVNVYSLQITFAKSSELDEDPETRETNLTALEDVSKQFIIRFEENLRLVKGSATIFNGQVVSAFNLYDSNIDGVVLTFEVEIETSKYCV